MCNYINTNVLPASNTDTLQNSKVDNMLFSYKMTHDTGFAPNPFHGFMTLANCKWQIRKIKNPEKDKNLYIAGFTSKFLCGETVGEERLIYIMKVTEKLTYKDYFTDPRFQCKIPPRNSNNLIAKAGDNIYKPANTSSGFVQLENCNHNCGSMEDDLKGKYVLISNDFYYFGCGAIPVDNLGINIPRVQAGHDVKSANCKTLLDYLEQRNYQKNIAIHPPHTWKTNEPFN